jgi:radical SAM enzyme (TIGR01210 family)
MALYPAGAAARDRFVLDRRPSRADHDPWRAQGVVVENERAADGTIIRAATVFLTGRECPWRCAMCDLWRYTTVSDTPPGAIAAQIVDALRSLEPTGPDVLKLYNAGSFFDLKAVPVGDYDAVARSAGSVRQVVVESHPALVGDRTASLMNALSQAGAGTTLEVAMGLETAHPDALERLHKRMTFGDFARAADRLATLGATLRVFLLVSPPFVPAPEQDEWLLRSVDAALSCGASVISLIPTRAGNGALEALAEDGLFRMPSLLDLERSQALALQRAAVAGAGAAVRIFADLWDLTRFAICTVCLEARRRRLQDMNLHQQRLPDITCVTCGAGAV